MSKNSEESEEKSLLPKGSYSTLLLFYKKLTVKGKRRNTLMLGIKHRQKSDNSFYASPIP